MAYTKMATFVNLPSGTWRAIIRRKGRYISETFKLREDARRWATAQESAIDRGLAPMKTYVASKTSLAHLIDLHIDDLADAKKPIGGRSWRRCFICAAPSERPPTPRSTDSS